MFATALPAATPFPPDNQPPIPSLDSAERLLTAWKPLLERINAGCSAPPAYEHLAAATTVVNDVAKEVAKELELRIKIAQTPHIWPSLRNAFIFTRNHLFCVFGVGRQGVACATRAERAVDLAAAHFQLVRNLCAGVPGNQKDAWEQGLYEPAEEIMSYLCSWCASTKDCCSMMKDKVSKCVNLGTQMLANMMTCNPEVQDKLWPRYFEDCDLLKQLLTTCDIHRVTYTLICIHNCIHKCPERCMYLTQTTIGRDILKHLLDKAAQMLQEECSAFDFIYAIFSNMIELDLTPSIIQALCHGRDPNRPRILTKHHITFLQLLDGLIDAQHSRPSPPIEIGIDTSLFLVAVIKKLVGNITRIASEEKDTLGEDKDFGLDIDGLILILEFLGRVTVELGPDAKMKLMRAGLGETLIALITSLTTLFPRSTLKSASSSENPFSGLKPLSLKIISNLSYEAREVQDEFRRIGGIPVVLGECNIDDHHPYVKEYAILALRNLCDANPENQAVISQLQPIDISSESQSLLKKQGLEGVLGDDGGVRIRPVEEMGEIVDEVKTNGGNVSIRKVEL